MSEKRDVVIKVRLYPEQAERWRTAAVKAGATDLSTFIRDLVDEEIQWEPVSPEEMDEATRLLHASITKAISDEPVVLKGFLGPKDERKTHAEVAELADAPASSPGDESREGSTPSLGTPCPRKFTHRPGVYCTACGQTPA